MSITKGGVAALYAGKAGPGKKGITFKLLSVQRYIIDSTFESRTGLKSNADGSVYDVVLADQKEKTRCLLDPALNYAIESGDIAAGDVMKVTQCTTRHDEASLGAPAFLVIGAWQQVVMESKADAAKHKKLMESLAYNTAASSLETERDSAPVVGIRGCYYPMWDEDEFDGPSWRKGSLSLDDADVEAFLEERMSLKQVFEGYSQGVIRATKGPPLVVRVVEKSRVFHFASPKDTKKNLYPMRCQLLVEDHSGAGPLQLWNNAVQRYFHYLNVGDLVLVSEYKVKAAYGDMAESYSHEISVNPSHPTTYIYHLTEEQANYVAEVSRGVPPLQENITPISSLDYTPDDTLVNLTAVVAWAGPLERVRDQRGRFHRYRWIIVRDRSTDNVAPVQIYTNGSGALLDINGPGQILRLRRLRVNSVTEDSVGDRNVFLQSTYYTQINLESVKELATLSKQIVASEKKVDPKGVTVYFPASALAHNYGHHIEAFPRVSLTLISDFLNAYGEIKKNETITSLVQGRVRRIIAKTQKKAAKKGKASKERKNPKAKTKSDDQETVEGGSLESVIVEIEDPNRELKFEAVIAVAAPACFSDIFGVQKGPLFRAISLFEPVIPEKAIADISKHQRKSNEAALARLQKALGDNIFIMAVTARSPGRETIACALEAVYLPEA